MHDPTKDTTSQHGVEECQRLYDEADSAIDHMNEAIYEMNHNAPHPVPSKLLRFKAPEKLYDGSEPVFNPHFIGRIKEHNSWWYILPNKARGWHAQPYATKKRAIGALVWESGR